MSSEEFSDRQQFRGDRVADNDLGTKVTTTGGRKKKVVGAKERKDEPAAAGDVKQPQQAADERSITRESEE